jgi:sugar lactone lactonase YvrE
MFKAIETVNDVKTKVGESARWNFKDQCLYWIDVHQPHLHCFNPKTKYLQSYDLPAALNCIDSDINGELIGIMSNSLVKISIKSNKAEVSVIKTELLDDDSVVFNDGLLDLRGNLWVGTMDKSFQLNTGNLYRISTGGDIMTMDEGFFVSNGMGFSPDNNKYYFTDSLSRLIYQYNFNSETCSIENRKPLIQFTEEQGFPDGLFVDREGNIWIAGWASHHVYQYNPQGELMKRVRFPTKNLTSCCFGGTDLKTMFVTSASYDVLNNSNDTERFAGSMFIWTKNINS